MQKLLFYIYFIPFHWRRGWALLSFSVPLLKTLDQLQPTVNTILQWPRPFDPIFVWSMKSIGWKNFNLLHYRQIWTDKILFTIWGNMSHWRQKNRHKYFPPYRSYVTLKKLRNYGVLLEMIVFSGWKHHSIRQTVTKQHKFKFKFFFCN